VAEIFEHRYGTRIDVVPYGVEDAGYEGTETLERLGTAIKLGLLEPGSRLPAERELCGRLGIARSTLRQALTALVQSGHLRAVRGRGGGTFVVESPPRAPDPSVEVLAGWRDALTRARGA